MNHKLWLLWFIIHVVVVDYLCVIIILVILIIILSCPIHLIFFNYCGTLATGTFSFPPAPDCHCHNENDKHQPRNRAPNNLGCFVNNWCISSDTRFWFLWTPEKLINKLTWKCHFIMSFTFSAGIMDNFSIHSVYHFHKNCPPLGWLQNKNSLNHWDHLVDRDPTQNYQILKMLLILSTSMNYPLFLSHHPTSRVPTFFLPLSPVQVLTNID